MHITAIRPSLKNLALTRPYTIATKTVTDVESAFLEIELANGIIGIGAANPAVNVVGEGPRDTYALLQTEQLANLLVGKDVRHFQGLIDAVATAFPHKPGTLAAVDLALHDAFCQHLGIAVVDFYGRHHTALPTSVTIGIKDVAATVAEAQEYKDAGFRVLKVKLGLDVDTDIARLQALRAAYGDYFTIRVDANQGYTLPALQHFLKATRTANLELIEQPLLVGDEAPLLQLSAAERQLLAADESLKDAQAALKWAGQPLHFGIYNIKLMKCGGIRGALQIANIAQAAGINLFWGCNDESLVSITAALHVAFACPHTRYIDLDGSLDLAKDGAKGGFLLENGIMRLPNAAGLGVQRL